jgi:formamidopyrimidine-DNA glycosylase
MPELPEVETVRRGLEQQTSGFKVAKVAVHRNRAIASPPDPEAFCWALTGCSLGTWSRRGKYLYAELEREGAAAGHWGVHLRMTGQNLMQHKQSVLLLANPQLRRFLKPSLILMLGALEI